MEAVRFILCGNGQYMTEIKMTNQNGGIKEIYSEFSSFVWLLVLYNQKFLVHPGCQIVAGSEIVSESVLLYLLLLFFFALFVFNSLYCFIFPQLFLVLFYCKYILFTEYLL